MALQLILGNSGSGKTHYLYQTVIEEARQHLEQNYLVIVPEQFTMQTQKELVTKHPSGGILNIDVLSFGRLAHRIFQELGNDYGPLLDDEGKNLILRKLAGDYQGELQLFGKNLKKLGYISEIKSVISEFMQYDIGVEDVEHLKEKFADKKMLSYKLADIQVMYGAFATYLEEHQYITGEELLDVLCDVIKDSEILKESVITLDGFTGFTPVQMRVIGKLLKVCKAVYITVTIDESAYGIKGTSSFQLFGLSKETIFNCGKLAKEIGAEIKEPIWMVDKAVHRLKDNEPLSFLESHLFRYKNTPYEGKLEEQEISIHKVRNAKEESMWVAREVRKLVRTTGCRYRDVAVIASSLENYGEYLKQACALYEIPVFTDHKRSILLNSFIEHLRSLVNMIQEEFTYESVFRFMKSGFISIPLYKRDELENYVLAVGIRGYKNWKKEWTKLPQGVGEKQLAKLNQIRSEFMSQIEDIYQQLHQKPLTVEGITVSIYQYFVEHKIEGRIHYYTEELREQGELALEKEYSQIYEVVLQLFDKFVALLGDEIVTLVEYSQLLDAGIEEARIGIIPPTIDNVLIGDLTRTRLTEVEYLFIVGANDAFLPGNMSSGGILSESDRDTFISKDIRLKPNGKEQMYIQKFYLYQNLTKPKKRLYASFAKTTLEGKSMRPAYVINEIQKLFPQLSVREEIEDLNRDELMPKSGFSYIIEGLSQEELQMKESWQELYRWYATDEKWESTISQVKKANQFNGKNQNLSSEVAAQLYGEVLRNSVSRLEKFSACPYAHFLDYGLRLRERELGEFKPMDIGNVIHDALELYGNLLEEKQIKWRDVSLENQKLYADAMIEESVKDYGNGVLDRTSRDTYMVDRMKRMMRRTVKTLTEQLKCGAFEPTDYEMKFGYEEGQDQPKPIQLDDGHEMILRGKIDRVDTYTSERDGTFVKVMDYKTGKKEFDESSLYYGLQLQLMVYLNAAMSKQSAEIVIPAGVFYYRVDDPILNAKSNPTSTSVEESDKELLYQLNLDGRANDKANVIHALDSDFTVKSYAIPAERKKDGNLKATSKTATEEELNTYMKFTEKKVQELGNLIVKGDISISPYELDKMKGCSYCEYQRICGFDVKLDGYEYRKLSIEKEVKELMDEYLKSGEEGEDGN